MVTAGIKPNVRTLNSILQSVNIMAIDRVAHWDRSSSNYFDRRSEPDGFLRRQAPVNHYRERPYRSSNGPFARDISDRSGGSSSSNSAGHYRSGGSLGSGAGHPSPSSWSSSYETGSSSRYNPPPLPPHDHPSSYMDAVVVGGGAGSSSGDQRSSDFSLAASSASKRTASALSSSVSTPLSTRKRKIQVRHYSLYSLYYIFLFRVYSYWIG